MSPPVQARYVAKRCAAGQEIDFRELPDSGHVEVMGAGATAAFVDWTAALFAGEPVPAGCATPPDG